MPGSERFGELAAGGAGESRATTPVNERSAVNTTHTRLVIAALLIGPVSICLTGCEFLKTDSSRFLSPDKVIRKSEDGPSTMGIINSATALDQAERRVPNSTFPTPRDLYYDDSDYVIGAGDVVAISILDLYYEGVETSVQRTISESGFLDLPLLSKRIEATGLSKEQLKQRIISRYSDAGILRPDRSSVSIELLVRRKSVFSILGAVSRPGAYQVTRPDMRLMEALAIAGDISQANIKWIYVIRQPKPMAVNGKDQAPPAGGADGSTGPKPSTGWEKAEEDVTGDTPASPGVLSLSMQEGSSPTAETDPDQLQGNSDGWIRKDGSGMDNSGGDSGVTVETPGPNGTTPAGESSPFGFPGGTGKGSGSRIVAIDLKKLQQGDPMMNVVIRDNDVIQVPILEVGEFYVTGEVNRPGVFTLTGRDLTIKQGIAAAGGFNPLAWPENTVLIRRINENQEQFIPIDLEAIYRGREQDYYLKPNDILAVGTNWRASFMAVFRNAFRMTYGFGFIYDRNFAEPLDLNGDWHDSSRFKRW